VIQLPDRTIFIVVDGAGGTSYGATAAHHICVSTTKRCQRKPPDDNFDWSKWWLEALDCEMASEPSLGQAAAVIVDLRNNGQITGASVGDCEAWTFSKDEQPKNLTFAQNRKPLLGGGLITPVQKFETHLSDNTTLLIATDGLWKYLNHTRIAHDVTTWSLHTAADALIADVRLKNGSLQDDVALALVKCHNNPHTR